MNPFNQSWSLLKEYYPDDISDEDYEEAEYAQNPQWPHKNWMESPQWPQLCDFVIEGVDYNGCGRVIDGEEVTGLPMMSGQAMCHDCLREVAGPPPKIVVQGTPKLEDDSWQDTIELGEPMDMAFQLLKMPQEARAFAEQAHEGQMYGEEPYMYHVDEVASQFQDPLLQRIAYLHDVVEDGKVSIDDIHERFGEEVGHGVDAMTRRPDENYFDYIQRVGEHPHARQVKVADLTHNLSGDPPGSLRQRYEKALEMLS